MNTTKSTVKLSLAKEYNQNCYIQYFSAIGQRPLGTIQELKKNPDTLDIPTLIGSELQDLPSDTPHFLLNMSSGLLLVYGIKGGICATFGLEDYSQYTKQFKDNGDFTYEYTTDCTYMCVLNKRIYQTLTDFCIDLYRTRYNKDPVNIYIKVSSKPEFPSKITNQIPDDINKYKLTENITYSGKYKQQIVTDIISII